MVGGHKIDRRQYPLTLFFSHTLFNDQDDIGVVMKLLQLNTLLLIVLETRAG